MDKIKTARIYIRVSTTEQNTERQHNLIEQVKEKGFYIAGVYAEKASGTTIDRAELQRLIKDLQPGDWVFAESIDRITRLPPREAEALINEITKKGAKIQVPEVFDEQSFDLITKSLDETNNYLIEPFIECIQKIFLRMALNISYEDWTKRKRRQEEGIAIAKNKGKYKGRRADKELHKKIIKLRLTGMTIHETAATLNCSPVTVTRVTRAYKEKNNLSSITSIEKTKNSK